MDDIYIKKVLSGDTEAYRYFLKTYKDMAYQVSVSILKDPSYAEEAVQDAFMKAFRGLKSFNRTATFKSWFYRIVINEAFQRLRKIKRERVVFAPHEDILTLESTSVFDSDEEEQKYLIGEALNRLPPNESLALSLFYLESYSLKEIGNITGWSMSNAKVILHRARKTLRLILGSVLKPST